MNVPGHQSPAASVRSIEASLRVATGPTVLVADDLVVTPAALAPVTHDPFAGTSMLVHPTGRDGNVRVRHHLVTSVGTACHDVTAPDHVSVGALVISGKDASRAADELATLARALESGQLKPGEHDLVELVAVSLVRGEITVKAIDLVDVPWFRSPPPGSQRLERQRMRYQRRRRRNRSPTSALHAFKPIALTTVSIRLSSYAVFRSHSPASP